MERTLSPAPPQAGGFDGYRAAVQFRGLGPIEVTENGCTMPSRPTQPAVLALLIEYAGRSVSTGSLIEGVYGDTPPSGARRSTSTSVQPPGR